MSFFSRFLSKSRESHDDVDEYDGITKESWEDFNPPWLQDLAAALSRSDEDEAKSLADKQDTDELVVALFAAISTGKLGVACFLVDYGVDLSGAMGDAEQTPLHLAVEAGDTVLVRELLHRGNASAFINLGDSDGWTALHIAAREGQNQIIQELLAYRADIDALDKLQQTPLQVVVYENHAKDTLELLLDNDAEVNTKDIDGNSPLHDAVMKNNLVFVEMLLKMGADPDVANVDGRSARDVATGDPMYAQVVPLFATVQPVERQERPTHRPPCVGAKKHISEQFRASVKFYYHGAGEPHVQYGSYGVPVYKMVYEDQMRKMEDHFMRDRDIDESQRPQVWRWIHLPATNVC